MPSLLPLLHRLPAALLVGLAAAHTAAQADPPNRAVMDPAPGVQLSYERQGPLDTPTPPGRFDGTIATPAGILRTTVRASPNEEQRFQRGDTTFELPSPVLDGQLQVREREAGGLGATWRARLGAGLAADAQSERTPIRSGEALQLQQQFTDGNAARAQVSSSRTAAAQGRRWDLEVTHATSSARWSAGIDASERSYVSSSGGLEPRAGVRLGTQWLVLPNTRMEARYTRHVRWDTEEPLSSVMLGTRFDLPRRASLVTGVEVDGESRHKASATLIVPLEER
jgi:hypothetical protein